jgi:GntR family transcriptional regulator
VRTGSPLIELVRIVYDQSDRAVQHLHALYRPDRYAFEMDLVRSAATDSHAWSPVDRRSKHAAPHDRAQETQPNEQGDKS